jgi:hypothetical protein
MYTKKQKIKMYEVNIDFDEASRCWKKNKSPLGNGTYKYVCGAITKTGNKCKNHPNCKLHNKQYKKITNNNI